MSIFYKSSRIGKNGKRFTMYKFRTLHENVDSKSAFVTQEQYTKFGKFLRKTKLDELPQLFNVIKRDMNLIGPRPEEERTIEILPKHIREMILSVRPGLTDLASLFFINEEKILLESEQKQYDYWTKVKPMKFILQAFYVENRCLSLDLWILFQTCKQVLKSFFKWITKK